MVTAIACDQHYATGHDATGHDATGHDATGHDATGHDAASVSVRISRRLDKQIQIGAPDATRRFSDQGAGSGRQQVGRLPLPVRT
jgi:hypothetical protein